MSDTVEARLKKLEKEVTTLKDIEAIKKVQVCYGYYLEHIMYKEVADLWTDDGEMYWLAWGVSKGKAAIRELWKAVKERFLTHGEYMHLAPQISPFITVNPDGKTAHGRWYTLMGEGAFVYESDYVKEDGVWKIKILRVSGLPRKRPMSEETRRALESQDEVEKERAQQEYFGAYPFTERLSRLTTGEYGPFIRPFHFKHPVTGKKTSEEEWNKEHPLPMPPGGENWVKSQK